MTDADPASRGSAESAAAWTPTLLVRIRSSDRLQMAALVVASLAGIATGSVHWLGLFAAGMLVGLVSRTVVRAVLAGLVVGSTILVVQVLITPGMTGAEFLALSPPSYVTVAAGLGAPAWGALIRVIL